MIYKKVSSITKSVLIISAAAAISVLYTQNKIENEVKAIEADKLVEKIYIQQDSKSNRGVFAVLKPDLQGNWCVLDDQGHSPGGITKVLTYPDRIEVFYDLKYREIYWSAITPDEALAISDTSVGASVGLEKSIIYMSQEGKQIDPHIIKDPGANIWIYVNGVD